jgi:hypothetical protein
MIKEYIAACLALSAEAAAAGLVALSRGDVLRSAFFPSMMDA